MDKTEPQYTSKVKRKLGDLQLLITQMSESMGRIEDSKESRNQAIRYLGEVVATFNKAFKFGFVSIQDSTEFSDRLYWLTSPLSTTSDVLKVGYFAEKLLEKELNRIVEHDQIN